MYNLHLRLLPLALRPLLPFFPSYAPMRTPFSAIYPPNLLFFSPLRFTKNVSSPNGEMLFVGARVVRFQAGPLASPPLSPPPPWPGQVRRCSIYISGALRIPLPSLSSIRFPYVVLLGETSSSNLDFPWRFTPFPSPSLLEKSPFSSSP